MGRPKKAPTEQIRLATDIVQQAWRIAVLKGYRQAGDFVSDFLRPHFDQMERELLAERSREMGAKRKPKGGESS